MESPITTVGRLYDHRFLDELASAVSEVSAAALATGEKGKVNVVIEVEARGREQMTVNTRTAIRVTLPKPKAKSAIFFMGKDGLQASDPRQAEMQVRETGDGNAELRAPEWQEPTVRDGGD